MCTEGSRVETQCYQQLFLPHMLVKWAKTVFFFYRYACKHTVHSVKGNELMDIALNCMFMCHSTVISR